MGVGLLYTPATERICQFLFPPKTREEVAERRMHVEVPRWVERLATKEQLRLTSKIDVVGPFLCPFVENFGDDMWLARGWFESIRMREVDEDLIWASREIQRDLQQGMVAEVKGILAKERGIHPEEVEDIDPEALMPTPDRLHAMPADFVEQMNFVSANAEEVYDQLRSAKRAYEEEHAAGLI